MDLRSVIMIAPTEMAPTGSTLRQSWAVANRRALPPPPPKLEAKVPFPGVHSGVLLRWRASVHQAPGHRSYSEAHRALLHRFRNLATPWMEKLHSDLGRTVLSG